MDEQPAITFFGEDADLLHALSVRVKAAVFAKLGPNTPGLRLAHLRCGFDANPRKFEDGGNRRRASFFLAMRIEGGGWVQTDLPIGGENYPEIVRRDPDTEVEWLSEAMGMNLLCDIARIVSYV